MATALLEEKRSPDLVTRGFSEVSAATMDLLTEMAELPETVKAILSGVKWSIQKTNELRSKEVALRAKARRQPQRAPEILDEIASLWMNYRYGLGPIAYTIQDAVSYLEKRGNLYSTSRLGENRTLSFDQDGWSCEIPFRDRFWGKTQVDIGSPLKHIKMDLLSTLWELKSLSFVYGWFFNVGDFIASLSPPSGAKQWKYSYSRQARWTGVLTHDSGLITPASVNFYNLSPLTQSESIGLTFSANLNTKRALDALSLSWFAFRNHQRRSR